MKPVSITSVIPNVMGELLAFSMGNTDTNKSFFRKIKYNLVIETIRGRFFVICFITWLIPATCEELDDNVCVLCNYVDNFLHSFAPLY